MPHIQTVVTLLIVAGAALLLVRRIYKSLKKSDSAACDCGCSACDTAQSRRDSQNRLIP